MREIKEQEKKIVLDEVMRLLDISIDIKSRMDDIEFSEIDGNEIIYVFDENVFEVFINPTLHQFSVSSFHDRNWTPQSKRGERQFQDQANLLAAESLMAGELPGSSSDAFYMTGWHQRELGSRLEKHAKEIANYTTADYVRVSEEINWKAELRDALEGHKQHELVVSRFRDQWLDVDEELIVRQKGLRVGSLLRHSRMLSRMFVKSQRSERIEQLNRIVTLDVSQRLSSLEERFDIKLEQSLLDSAHEWMQRLLDEREKKGRGTKRSRAGFSVDANSLSLIQWISDNVLEESQRIVFVTGDRLLYDAYRRWYCDVAVRDNVQHQFVVRRLSQFSPVMSTDEIDAEDDQPELFSPETHPSLADEILSTIEVSLLPFNLSLLKQNIASEQRDAIFRARHSLVLQYEEQEPEQNVAIDYFVRKLNLDYFADHKRKIRHIRNLWRRIERLTIAVYYGTLVDRLSTRDRVFTNAKFDGFETEEEFISAVRSVISDTADDLFNRLAEIELPKTQQFLEDLKAESFINTRRSPKSIWLLGRDGRSVIHQIRKWRQTREGSSEILKAVWGSDGFVPYDVFGLAAVFALYSHAWKEAQNFSSLAIRSGFAHGASTETQVELEYLNCIAKRFLFADDSINFPSAGSKVGMDEEARIARLEETMADVLESIEGSKHTCQRIDDPHHQSLFLCRLALEKSSLDLMHVTSILGVQSHSGKKSKLSQRIEDSVFRLDRVQKMLMECEDPRKIDLQEQIDGTFAAAFAIHFIATEKPLSTDKFQEDLRAKLDEASAKLHRGGKPSYYLLSTLYSATQLIENGANHEYAQAIKKAIKAGENERRRIRFDDFLQKLVIDKLKSTGLLDAEKT